MCLGIPGRIVSITSEDPMYRSGKVDFGGIQKEVSLAYTPEAGIGEYVIVHAGFALNVIDEAEANQVFQYLQEIEEAAASEESS